MAEKEFEVLEELIRTAVNHLDPVDKYSYLYKKNMVDTLHGSKPDCFLKLKRKDGGPMGQDFLIPVCNRMGIQDRDILKLSLKTVQNFIDSNTGGFDMDELHDVMAKLKHRHDVFSKDVPKPASAAGHKANTTRMFGNIKKYIERTNG